MADNKLQGETNATEQKDGMAASDRHHQTPTAVVDRQCLELQVGVHELHMQGSRSVCRRLLNDDPRQLLSVQPHNSSLDHAKSSPWYADSS
jgi:hypothetical protein